MDPAELQRRLRGGAPRLAARIVDDALATPIAELVEPGRAFLESAARALAASPAAERFLAERAAAVLADLPAERAGATLPPPVVAAAREIAALPWRVPRELTTRLLGREPVRQMLREQVLRTLVEFARKVAAPFTENPVARGLSKLAFGKKETPTTLGSIKRAVSGGAEGRAEAFADTAVTGVIEGIAAELADPARAGEQAAIRGAILDGLLDETGVELSRLSAPQVPALLAIVRRALGAWAPTLGADLAAAIEVGLAQEAARPLGDVLADLGLREVVAEHAVRLVGERLATIMEGDAFARWLGEVLA